MAAKKSVGRVNAELEKALAAEVKEICKKDEEKNFLHPILDRMRVYNAALKLEAIKLKADSPEWGDAFKGEGHDEE